jgi:hypothetical protein
MALDPSIILGAKAPQFDMAQFSPMNALTSAMKLKQLQQEGDINALNLRERRGMQEFLSGGRETEAPNLSSPDTRTMLATRFGETGRKVATSLTSIDTAQAALLKAETDEKVRRNALSVSKTAQYRDLLTNVNDQRSALQWIQLQQNDPDLADSPIAKVSIMDAARSIPADPAGFAQWKQQAALGISEYIKQNKPSIMQINRSGATDVIQTPGLGGAPTTVGTFADVPLPAPVEAQNIRIARESRPVTNIKLPAQEGAFESGLGKGQSERILANQVVAQDAAEILRTNQVGRDLLKSGAITGTGANLFVGLNNALAQAGIDFGYADAAANSQAYVAAMGANVGRIIKQFGAGTGLSDADREFAEKIAAGQITLTETALRRILNINDRAANRVIDLHNSNVKNIKTNIPLTVEKPVFDKPAPSAAQIPTATTPARAAPAVAPMYASNPKTGQRIMSTDGGNTWTPAR